MIALPFLLLALAGEGLSRGLRNAAIVVETTSETVHSLEHPSATQSSPSPSTSPPGHAAPKPDDNTKAFLTGALVNERAAGKAEQCRDVDQETFVDKAVRFLGAWKPDGGPPARSGTTTTRQLLERLVQYQDVYRLMGMETPPSSKLPDNIVEEIRKMKYILDNRGILRGGNDRVLDALEVIFDDICADTGKTAQIPRKVQETVDVILRGVLRS
ncbi:uncharacterized protein PG986_000093 [Apiospora aurea]|uniref:Uncharacterized protein n=1 Tax=Apiospora aurea TaxID=335848 RepID=A0ABR1QT12_9PEZI